MIASEDIRRDALRLARLYVAAARRVSLFQPPSDAERRIAARFGVMVFDTLRPDLASDDTFANLGRAVICGLSKGIGPEAAMLYGIARQVHRTGKTEEDLFKPVIGRPVALKYWLRRAAKCQVFGLWPWPFERKEETCRAQNPK